MGAWLTPSARPALSSDFRLSRRDFGPFRALRARLFGFWTKNLEKIGEKVTFGVENAGFSGMFFGIPADGVGQEPRPVPMWGASDASAPRTDSHRQEE
jgi:hypothetical protein